MSERPPVERTTSYTTDVATLDEALAFVMSNLGVIEDLTAIRIEPFWQINDEGGPVKRYTAAVTGVVELAPFDPRPDLRAL